MDISLLKKIVDYAEEKTKGMSKEVSKVVVDIILKVWDEVGPTEADPKKEVDREELEANKRDLKPTNWKPRSCEGMTYEERDEEMRKRKLIALHHLSANGGSLNTGELFRLLDWDILAWASTRSSLESNRLVTRIGHGRGLAYEITDKGRALVEDSRAA